MFGSVFLVLLFVPVEGRLLQFLSCVGLGLCVLGRSSWLAATNQNQFVKNSFDATMEDYQDHEECSPKKPFVQLK